MNTRPAKSRLRSVDLFVRGTQGLRTRWTRTLLTAIGIAICIATMDGVVSIRHSSNARRPGRAKAHRPLRIQTPRLPNPSSNI